MTSARVTGLRSVELGVPDLEKSADFYRDVWGLEHVLATGDTIHMRGTGAEHHVLTLRQRPKASFLGVHFAAADHAAVNRLHAQAKAHGASVGELVAAMPLIARIRARAFNVLVTTGTVTSAALAEKRLPPGVIHQFVPLDAPAFVAKFLDHWRPSLALLVESDLWPNTIMGCARRHIPLIVVNGRLSARSFERWRYFPGTIEALLRRLDLCLVRTAADAARFGALGAPRVITTGNLKLDVPPLPADERKLAKLIAAIGGRPPFTDARSELSPRAFCSCSRCPGVNSTWCSRCAASCTALGRAATPPLPPLKLTRLTVTLLTTVVL